jgi:hypothetical protein
MYSSLRIPGLELGYGVDRGAWLVDWFVHGSTALSGRLQQKDDKSSVRGAWGGTTLTLAWHHLHLHLDAGHLFTGRAHTQLWDVRGLLCTYLGARKTTRSGSRVPSQAVGPRARDYDSSLCMDGMHLSWQDTANATPRQQTTLGISFLLGSFSRLDVAGDP